MTSPHMTAIWIWVVWAGCHNKENSCLIINKQALQDLMLLMYESEPCRGSLKFYYRWKCSSKEQALSVWKENFKKSYTKPTENYWSKFVAQDELMNLLENDFSKIKKRLWRKFMGMMKLWKLLHTPDWDCPNLTYWRPAGAFLIMRRVQ